MEVASKSFRIAPDEGAWEPASYNIRTPDGREYGRWRRVLRDHRHGLTVISHYRAPPGKAWKIIGKASALGEEVFILEGAYYDASGRIRAGPGTFMFNAPGARHGGVSFDLTLYIHCLQRRAGRDRIRRVDQFRAEGAARSTGQTSSEIDRRSLTVERRMLPLSG